MLKMDEELVYRDIKQIMRNCIKESQRKEKKRGRETEKGRVYYEIYE